MFNIAQNVTFNRKAEMNLFHFLTSEHTSLLHHLYSFVTWRLVSAIFRETSAIYEMSFFDNLINDACHIHCGYVQRIT